MRPFQYLLGIAVPVAAAAGWFLRGFYFKRRAARLTDQLSFIAGEEGSRMVRDPGSGIFTDLVIGINRVLEAYAELKEERVRFDEARREWFANISHDIRTPLTSIIGYLDALRDGVADSSAKKDAYLTVLKNKSEELKNMVESMFQFARLKTEEAEIKKETVDIAETLRRCLVEFAPLLEREGFAVDVGIPEDGPIYAMGDRLRLERLFRNLIHNVIKHAADGRYLRVALETEDDRLVVTVADKGPGIPQAIREAVLREQRIKGGGFGLHIAKHIADSSGGDLTICNSDAGGTAVVIKLPRVKS